MRNPVVSKAGDRLRKAPPLLLQNRYASSKLSGTLADVSMSVNALRASRECFRLVGLDRAAEEQILEIEVRTQGQVKVVKLRGKLVNGPPLDRLNATFTDLVAAGDSRFVLDLEEMPMIDSSGIGLLVRHYTTAKQRGGAVKLLNPSKFTIQTLKLVRMLNLFEVFEDAQLAVASFG
jgi:anti-sigma B factor antagonist